MDARLLSRILRAGSGSVDQVVLIRYSHQADVDGTMHQIELYPFPPDAKHEVSSEIQFIQYVPGHRN